MLQPLYQAMHPLATPDDADGGGPDVPNYNTFWELQQSEGLVQGKQVLGTYLVHMDRSVCPSYSFRFIQRFARKPLIYTWKREARKGGAGWRC